MTVIPGSQAGDLDEPVLCGEHGSGHTRSDGEEPTDGERTGVAAEGAGDATQRVLLGRFPSADDIPPLGRSANDSADNPGHSTGVT